MNTPEIEERNESEHDNVVVVRLRTTCWQDQGAIHQKRSLTVLKRKSRGHNFLIEDAICAGANETFRSIVNFATCRDGVYRVHVCNVSRDYETGYVDGYDLKLVPYGENPKGN